jgi:hypothetical protein
VNLNGAKAWQARSRRTCRSPRFGIDISSQVKPLIDSGVLTAAVITSVTMELALKILLRAFETKTQPPECSMVEASSVPDVEKSAITK